MSDRNMDWKVLGYIDVVSEGGHLELSIDIGLSVIKSESRYSHAIALKCISIFEKYKLDISVLERIFHVVAKESMPTYLIVDIGKKLIFSKNPGGVDVGKVIKILSSFQTIYCENVLRRVKGGDYRFEKTYVTKQPAGVFSFDVPSPFNPEKHFSIDKESGLFVSESTERNLVEIYNAGSGEFFYGDGEFIILDAINAVVDGTMSSNYIVDRYKKLSNVSRKHSEVLFIPRNYTPPRNYCHWICDYLPLIILFSNYIGKAFDLLFYEPISEYQRESLGLIKNVNIVECKEWDVVAGEEIFFTSMSKDFKHPMNLADPLLMGCLQDKILADVTCEPLHNIYLSRKKADRRHLVDESRLEAILEKNNFITVCCEDLSWLEQVELFSKAKNIVSVHGAGLTNMVFARNCLNVVELFPDGYGTNAFQIIADALGIKYSYYSNGSVTKNGSQFSDVNGDIEKIADYICNSVLA